MTEEKSFRIHLISEQRFDDLVLHLPTGYFVHFFATLADYLANINNYSKADVIVIDIKVIKQLSFAMLRNKMKDVKYLFIIDGMPETTANAEYYIMRNEFNAAKVVERLSTSNLTLPINPQ